jgi:hypothetical protein
MSLDLSLFLRHQHRLFQVPAIFHYRTKIIHRMRCSGLKVADLLTSSNSLIIPVAVVSGFLHLASD